MFALKTCKVLALYQKTIWHDVGFCGYRPYSSVLVADRLVQVEMFSLV